MAKQNPNINYTSGSSIINVKGTIVKANTVNDPTKYAAGQPVDPNSNDPLIQGLNYTIDGGPDGTGKVSYSKNGVNYDSLNSYAKSPAVYGAGYTANTTKAIQTAMQKNLATAISTSIPIQASAQNPNPGGNGGGATGNNLFNLNIADLEKNFKFGSVDKNLKGTNLQYPKDALYNKTQDYLQIGQYHYQPPKSDQLFSPDGTKKILTSGLQKTSALAEFLGIVKLPMPNSVTDSNNVSWGDDNMNNLSAAATADVVQNLDKYLAATTTGGLAGAIFGGGAQQGAALGAQGALLYKLLGSAGSQSAQALLKTAGASKVLSMAGFSVSPESILARGFGVVPNSNLELLFNSPTLREFTFQYRMSPRSKEEATDINKIIRFFKQGMAAKKQDKRSGNQEYGTAGAASYFLGTPNVFQLQYKTSNGNPIQGVNRIKTCALVGFSMNYTADGTWAAYDDGQPVSVIMNMSFKELEPIYDTDYQSSIFDGRAFTEGKPDPNVKTYGDLYPISPNDVGY
jgi:hypothetical protein